MSEIRNILPTYEQVEKIKVFSNTPHNQIVDLIGMDRLKLFLTFQENDGVYKDYLNKNIKFVDVRNQHTKTISPLGSGIVKNLTYDRPQLFEQPFYSKIDGTQDPIYSKEYRTSINPLGKILGKIKVPLKAVGDVSSCKIIFRIWGANISGEFGEYRHKLHYTKEAEYYIDGSLLTDVYKDYIFPLFTPVGTRLNTPTAIKIVMSYEDDTGIDLNNHVKWRCGADIGNVRQYKDPTTEELVTVSDESHDCEIYDDSLLLTDSFTCSFLWKKTWDNDSAASFMTIKRFDSTSTDLSVLNLSFYRGPIRVTAFYTDGTAMDSSFGTPELTHWNVTSFVFDKNGWKDKMKVYINGKQLMPTFPTSYLMGKPGVGLSSGLVTIGNSWGSATAALPGALGAVVISDKALNQDEINKLSNLLLNNKEVI